MILLAGCSKQECICDQATITYNPAVNTFEWRWRQNKRYGNDIPVTWKVKGNPKLCHFYHKEEGQILFRRDDPYKSYYSPIYGELEVANTHEARVQASLKGLYDLPALSYGSDTASYTDNLGARFFALAGNAGHWSIISGLQMTFKCVSTDKSTKTSGPISIPGGTVDN